MTRAELPAVLDGLWANEMTPAEALAAADLLRGLAASVDDLGSTDLLVAADVLADHAACQRGDDAGRWPTPMPT